MAENQEKLVGIDSDSSQKNEQDKKNPELLGSKKNAEIALVPAERMTRINAERKTQQSDALKMIQRRYKEGEVDFAKDMLAQLVDSNSQAESRRILAQYVSNPEMQNQVRQESLEMTKNESFREVIKKDFATTLFEVLLQRINQNQSIDLSNEEIRKEVVLEILRVLETKYESADAKQSEKLLQDKEKTKQARKWLQEKGYLPVSENTDTQELSSAELVRAFKNMFDQAEKETNSEKKKEIHSEFVATMAEQLGISQKEFLSVVESFRSPVFQKFKKEIEAQAEKAINSDGTINEAFFNTAWEKFEQKYKQEQPELAEKLFPKKTEKKEEGKQESGGMFFSTTLQGKDFIEFFKHDPILQNLQGQPALQSLWQEGTELTIRRTPDGPAYLLKFPTESGTQEIDFVLGDESAVFMRLAGKIKKLDQVSLKEFLSGNNPETTRKMNQFYSRAFLETTVFSGLFEHSTSAESLPEKNHAYQFLSEAFWVSSGEVFHETADFRKNFDRVLKITLGLDGNNPLGETDRSRMFSLEKDGKTYSLLDNQGKLKTSANGFFQNIQTLLAQSPGIQNQQELFSHPSFDAIVQNL